MRCIDNDGPTINLPRHHHIVDQVAGQEVVQIAEALRTDVVFLHHGAHRSHIDGEDRRQVLAATMDVHNAAFEATQSLLVEYADRAVDLAPFEV